MTSATLITKGDATGLILQPGATVSVKIDETVEASASYKATASADLEFEDYDPPALGDDHPFEKSAKCYNITETLNQAGIITYDCAYFGLLGERKRSELEIAYSGGTSSDPLLNENKRQTQVLERIAQSLQANGATGYPEL